MFDVRVFDNECGVIVAAHYGRGYNAVEGNKGMCFRDKENYPYVVVNICRLIVAPHNRGQGLGTCLMQNLVELADRENYELELMINAYGDLTYEQLEVFYAKFGFYEEEPGIWVRYPRGE